MADYVISMRIWYFTITTPGYLQYVFRGHSFIS
jgi:hypothetical protein